MRIGSCRQIGFVRACTQLEVQLCCAAFPYACGVAVAFLGAVTALMVLCCCVATEQAAVRCAVVVLLIRQATADRSGACLLRCPLSRHAHWQPSGKCMQSLAAFTLMCPTPACIQLIVQLCCQDPPDAAGVAVLDAIRVLTVICCCGLSERCLISTL